MLRVGSMRSYRQPRNRPAAHVATAANLRKRLVAVITAADRFALLVIGEFRASSHLHAARLGSRAPLARAGADQFTLELGKPA